MAGNTVKADLVRTYGYQGTYYGPGSGLDIPKGLADALGLTDKKAIPVSAPDVEVAAEEAPKPKAGAKTAAKRKR